MMGYPMALNVRTKTPKDSKLYIFDVSKAALERFVEEAKSLGEVVIASSSKEVADNAVCLHFYDTDFRTLLSRCCQKALTSNLLSSLQIQDVYPQPPRLQYHRRRIIACRRRSRRQVRKGRLC